MSALLRGILHRPGAVGLLAGAVLLAGAALALGEELRVPSLLAALGGIPVAAALAASMAPILSTLTRRQGAGTRCVG